MKHSLPLFRVVIQQVKNSHSGDQRGEKPKEERMRGEEIETMNTNKFFAVFLKSGTVKWGNV